MKRGPSLFLGGGVALAVLPLILSDFWIFIAIEVIAFSLYAVSFNVGTALKGAPVTYAIGPKQYLAVQAGGRHLHPVKYDNLQDSSYLFVFALN